MISRKTTLQLSEILTSLFYTSSNVSGYQEVRRKYATKNENLYEFLYVRNYDGWFCNQARSMGSWGYTYENATRQLKDFFLKLHTGESLASGTPDYTWDQRAKLGQQYLYNLAKDILDYSETPIEKHEALLRCLEVDGYLYRDQHLLSPESEILDIEETFNLLETLFTNLALGNKETAFHHLKLSADHYKSGKWDDSISNSRKFLECVLTETALFHIKAVKGQVLTVTSLNTPFQVREYLENVGLLGKKEKEVISSIYSLLSETGGHPYMAQNDQARLLRQLALTTSQFILLRLQAFKTRESLSEGAEENHGP